MTAAHRGTAPGDPPVADTGDTGIDDLLAGLTPAQRRAVTVEAAPLCVLAGAGAGKTRVLTRRIAYRVAAGSADASHVLVITFTRKAAGELGERLAGLGLRDRLQAGTFHAVAAAQLRRWWADRGVTAPVLLDRKARVLAPLAGARPGLAGVPLAELAGHIEWAKARLVGPDGFEAAVAASGRVVPVAAGALAALYGRYEDEKRRRGLVDFDDLLARCAEAFETDPAFASAQRWRWRHLFVDEFQDVNPLQHRLLLAWLGSGTDLCVVGDPNQAIYSWNGADPRLLDTIAERWPSSTVVRLDDNHRCTPQIVAAAATVLGDEGARLRSCRPDGPSPEVRSFSSDEAEAHGVAGAMRAAHADGLPWSQMAALVRTNAQVGVLSAAFAAAGVPHRAPGRAALLDDPVVAAVIKEWRRTPTRPVQMVAADLERALAGDAGDWPGPGARTDEAAAGLSALVDLARSFERFEGPGTVDGLLAWARAAGGDRPGADDAVTVCSFHRAKGLEWTAVWVCGLETGLVPIGRADTSAAEQEERRLLYVALTRAETRLACSWSQTRRFGAKAVPRSPSPWLAAVAGSAGPDDGGGVRRRDGSDVGSPHADVLGPGEWKARLDQQRRRLEEQRHREGAGRAGGTRRPRLTDGPRRDGGRMALPEPDRGILEALVSWRASVARSSGVPAHIVLHDRTLDALASLRPASTEDLVAVPGVGPVKAARLGPALLALLADRRASA